jgi:hypothetical protein
MAGLVTAIRSIFANDVDIHVSRELVTLKWNGQVRSIRPLVHLSTDGQARIVGLGDHFGGPSEPVTTVRVFSAPPEGVDPSTWADIVNTFMAYVLREARSPISVVKPSVRLHGASTLPALSGGSAAVVLSNAIIRSGAMHCSVED